jgi:hypothetical protein
VRVLVLETDVGAADEAIARLEAAGHEVVRCHDRDDHHAFPCNALIRGGSCPLSGEGVDLALTVRARPMPEPTAFEDGAVCALRAKVPVVVAGRVAWSPFERYPGVTIAGDDVVASCEAAAAAPLEEHGGVALAALREALTAAAVDADIVREARAVVTRNRWRLRAMLEIPGDVPQGVLGTAATRVTGALRALDTDARSIDVLTRVTAAA